MASDSAVRDFPDLKFVDHYERKIVSPEKEMISPTKEVLNPYREIGVDIDKSCQETDDMSGVEKETVENQSISSSDSDDDDNDVKEGKTEESDLDSGLDSSDNVSAENEKFVDRHEDVLDAEKPDTLKSSPKTLGPSPSSSRIVDELFNFINDENIDGLEDVDQKLAGDMSNNNNDKDVDWSLDAVNNNQEEIIEIKTEELQSEPNPEIEFILTTKTEPTPKIVEDDVSLVPDTPGDSNMNLYWYSTNLELDPGEIQDFKNAQEGGKDQEVQASTQDEYYREKLEDYKPPPAEDISLTENKTTKLEGEPASSNRWSPIYESASSRLLDLASELKSQPDEEKGSENNVTEAKTSDHPWGLEVENKHMLHSESRQEELPVVEPKFHPIADMSHDTQHDQTDSSMKVMFQVKKNVDLKQFDLNLANGKPRETSELKIDFKNEQRETSELKIDLKTEQTENAVDEADATGYMELKDKDLIKAQQADVMEAALDVDLKNSKEKENESIETRAVEMSKAESPKDQPDATGFMEMADQDMIHAQFQSTVHAQLSEKDVKNVDNMRKKSGDKNVSEQVQKEDIEVLQSEKQDSSELQQISVQETDDAIIIDINDLESNITNIEEESKGEDETDAVNQEMKIEFSHKVESEIQKSESLDLQVAKVKPVNVKHEPVEIKRKYKVGEDSEKNIIGKGGQLLRTETFVDQYFDDSCYTLTLNDNWLRKRNEIFEMKTSSSETKGEQVIVDEKIIYLSLQKMLQQNSHDATTKTLSKLMNDLDLSEFATFQTSRQYYELEECTLALDLTDFGFQSGDVMIKVDSPSKVPDAIQRMDKLAKDLGFHLLQGS